MRPYLHDSGARRPAPPQGESTNCFLPTRHAQLPPFTLPSPCIHSSLNTLQDKSLPAKGVAWRKTRIAPVSGYL